MEQSDFNYEHLFNLSPDLVCIAGFGGYFKKVNPAASDLLRYSTEELYTKTISEFVYPNDKLKTDRAQDNITDANTLYTFENRISQKIMMPYGFYGHPNLCPKIGSFLPLPKT